MFHVESSKLENNQQNILAILGRGRFSVESCQIEVTVGLKGATSMLNGFGVLYRKIIEALEEWELEGKGVDLGEGVQEGWGSGTGAKGGSPPGHTLLRSITVNSNIR